MYIPMATSLTINKSNLIIPSLIPCLPNFVCCYRHCCPLLPLPSLFLLLPILILSSPLTFSVASRTEPPTPIPSLKPTRQNFHPQFNILITLSLVLVLALLFSMGFLFRFLKLRKLRRSNPPSISQSDEKNKGNDSVVDGGDVFVIRKFKWDEIKYATKDFSVVIGQGGFSNVYLANLSDSTQGAVKVHVSSDRLNQVFKQELDILLRLKHDNIVKLVGYSDDLDEGAMVFEYVPNGNLQETLHEMNTSKVLPWKTRTVIAYQLAQAIEYLHEKCSLQIIHGDIKASNILLDENYNCKLCDFGSAKMGFSSTVMPPSRSRVKQVMIGSPGYTDPHYLRTGLVSKKNDVYSLGVIILELVTGIEAFCPEKGQLLTSMVATKLSAVDDMVDPRLGDEFDLEEAKAMASIAALCLDHSPTVRPSVSKIMQIMKEKIASVNYLDCHKQLM